VNYSQQTLQSPNPFVRFAHQNRLWRARNLLTARVDTRRVLDYGCGSGSFLAALSAIPDLELVGYEPYMLERSHAHLPIYSSLSEVKRFAPFDVITVLETVEHLSETELSDLLQQARALLHPAGALLFSAPIEIGPALLLKIFNRARRQGRFPAIPIRQVLAASFLGIPTDRAINIKTSHQGFDFRKTIRFLNHHFGHVRVAGYGPLPIGTWYGNSQVYFWLKRTA
jgi:SAM-dependent methyltransferase